MKKLAAAALAAALLAVPVQAAPAASAVDAGAAVLMEKETGTVLYEQEAEGLWTGHAPNYILTGVKGKDLHNQVRRTKITGMAGAMLVGELEEEHV